MKTALTSLHDIEEFLRSPRSLAKTSELYYSNDLNRREKEICALAGRRGLICRKTSPADLQSKLGAYSQEKWAGRKGSGAASGRSNKKKQRRISLLLISKSEDIEGGNRLSELWALIEERGEKTSERQGATEPSLPIVLILAGIQDPHNVGAILRSADLFGVTAVVLPSRRSASVNDVVRRVSAGASHHVPTFTVTNLARIVEELKKRDFWVFASGTSGKPIASIDLRQKTAIILGNEGKGVPQKLEQIADERLRIPTAGHVDSLNVSVASGIILYEARRQQGF